MCPFSPGLSASLSHPLFSYRVPPFSLPTPSQPFKYLHHLILPLPSPSWDSTSSSSSSSSNIPMFSFTNKKHPKKSKPDDMSSRRPRPRLDRRNAAKNIDYDAITSDASASLPHPSPPSSPELLRATRSLDLSPNYSNQTSFRIGGSIEGEVDLICRSLGLSGPEDFAISAAAWEASRARAHRSSSDSLPPSRLAPMPTATAPHHPPPAPTPTPPAASAGADLHGFRFQDSVEVRVREGGGDGGIRGVRPPTLTTPEAMQMSMATQTRSAPPTVSVAASVMKLNPSPSSVLNPPPSISLPEIEKVGSTWDLVMGFAPEEEGEGEARRRFLDYDEEDEEEEKEKEEVEEEEEEEVRVRMRLGEETSEDVTSTSNDDDSSSTTTEAMFVISPNGRFKRRIKSWMRGQLLGSGSFGTVYEGISE